jgi:NAD(P)H-hydrate epimerase
VVDALFGTGLSGEITGLPAELIAMVNAAGLRRSPSTFRQGLDADRGVPLGVAIEAELTIAFAAPKIGTVIHPGARYAGEVAVVDIGLADEAVRDVGPRAEAVTATDAARILRPRDPEAHKGTHGPPGGDRRLARQDRRRDLSARAATRAGAGLGHGRLPEHRASIVARRHLEAMTWPLRTTAPARSPTATDRLSKSCSPTRVPRMRSRHR